VLTPCDSGPCVLVLSGIDFHFFPMPCQGLWFAFALRTALLTQGEGDKTAGKEQLKEKIKTV